TLTPTSIEFGEQSVGVASGVRQVTLSNTGSAALVLTNIATSGDFRATPHCTTNLAVGASCTIDLTFTPTAGGLRSGQLSVNSAAGGSPQVVTLSGAGVSKADPGSTPHSASGAPTPAASGRGTASGSVSTTPSPATGSPPVVDMVRITQ